MTTGPIAGLRVLDCSRGMAGPRATGMLADYGADVVWVEPPGGDPCRRQLPAASSVFNRGKRSVVLDATTPEGIGRLLNLAERADVFVESWRPGVADRLGIGFEELRSRNPGLVYCSISGFGPEGPHRGTPGYEAIVHAVLGTMAEQAGHREAPIFQGFPFGSIGAAYLAVIGVLAALYRRHNDGLGRHVETSLLDGALAYLSMFWGETDAAIGQPLLSTETTATMRLVTRSFLCADGEYIGLHTGAVGAFGRLMKVLGLDDRIPPSATGMDIGVPLEPDQIAIVRDEIPRIMATEPRSVWVERLMEADVCAIEHLHPTEVFDSPQALHNRMVVDVDDAVLGRVQQVAPAAKFPAGEAQVNGPAPTPGQHTDAVLADLAGWPAPSPAPLAAADTRPLLDGVRIIDLGAYYAGPYSSRLLADLGADVIKLEPILGDQLRGLDRPFASAQAGKRAMAANLKDPALRPALDQLLQWADVVHHNLRPGAAERLGLDFESVHNANPRCVYLYAPGWGSTGPYRLRQSFAPMLSGYVGVTFEVAGEFNPPMPPVANEDPGNGLLGAVGILLALLRRQRTGSGEYVENSQLNATMTHMAHVVRREAGEVVGAGSLDPLQMGCGALERLYETADDWICLAAFSDDEIAGLANVLGIEILGCKEFASIEARRDHDYELTQLIASAVATRAAAPLAADLVRAGVAAAVPAGPSNHTFMNDPEQRRTGRVAELPHPGKGKVREVAHLVRVSDADVRPHRLAPELGADTDAILASLGYSHDAISELRQSGAIR